ncbi:hypothetical protein G7Z17_g1192 [Cylindrodendrum hubeiense]|uniref:BZIP domain-containing protein n=1 Tax=Cylindrodendrum hubeiense TaxID=595255 RepID=A0A9P5LMA4_9HYPO|nr:hypothetical protein G7Z17_g1192 [Cylindrodendrum hubeiense]
MNLGTAPHHSMDSYPDDSLERKKRRNRLSQQAFRRRQAESIRELRSLVDANQKPDNERIEALQRENSILRAQLIDVQNKMSRLLATVQTMSDSVSKTLDETASIGQDKEKSATEPQEPSFESLDTFSSPSCWLGVDETPAPEPMDNGTSADQSLVPMTVSLQDLDLSTVPNLGFPATGPLYEQIPKIWDFDYVVEAKMSDLIQGAPDLDVYVRVTDLVSAMSSLDDSESNQDKTLPAPDAASLFTTGKYARAAFRFLNMNRGPSFYKVEPALFGKYPELYDHTVDIMAVGIPLKPDTQLTLTPPKALDLPTAETYYSFIDFYLDSLDSF